MRTIKSIYYHNPSPQALEQMIVWIKSKGYRFISDDELYSILKSGSEPKEKLAFLSLDDGWRTNLALLPVIERHSVPMTVFVPIEPLAEGNYWWEYVSPDEERYKKMPHAQFVAEIEKAKNKRQLERSCMSEEELKLFASNPLVSVQAHTMSHPILPKVSEETLEYELSESKKRLELLIGKQVRFFSYPNGSFGEREIKAAAKYFDMAFTIKCRHIAPGTDIYQVPRIGLGGYSFFMDKIKYWRLWLAARELMWLLTHKEKYKKIPEYQDL